MTDEPRYIVRSLHLTKMQKRLYPEAAKRPFIVYDTYENRAVGMPDRYSNRSGPQARADRLNAKGADDGVEG